MSPTAADRATDSWHRLGGWLKGHIGELVTVVLAYSILGQAIQLMFQNRGLEGPLALLPVDAGRVLLALCVLVTIWFRQVRPTQVAVLGLVGTVVYDISVPNSWVWQPNFGNLSDVEGSYSQDLDITPAIVCWIVLYNAGVFARFRDSRWTAVGGIAAASLPLLLDSTVAGRAPAQVAAESAVMAAVCYLVGLLVRRRREASITLAREAMSGQELMAAAVADDRLRMARELHDVVSHHVSVMTLHIGASKAVLESSRSGLEADDIHERLAPALSAALGSGQVAMAEMRALVEVLRTSSANDATPGLGDLTQLLSAFGGAGLDVSVETTGRARGLPGALDRCAYRVIQESLTNVLKHADVTTARVGLTWRRDGVLVAITDDGHAANHPVPLHHGTGLSGMAERVRDLGGEVTAGHARGGGFEVVARLPYRLDTASRVRATHEVTRAARSA